MDLVTEGGFDALSIHALARALDYTPGALYRYFRSKDALIAALSARIIDTFGAALGQALERIPADAHLERATLALMTYRELARTAPHRFGLLSMLMAEPRMLVPEPGDAAPAVQAMVTGLQPLAASLKAAEDAGELQTGDAAQRALIGFSATHGVLQLRKQAERMPGSIDIDLLVAATLRALFIGWGATPDRIDAALATVSAVGGLTDPSGGSS